MKQLSILEKTQQLDTGISEKYFCSDLVDSAFLDILKILFGDTVLTKIRKEKPSTYQTLFKKFQELKYSATPGSSHKMILSFPFKTITSLMKESSKETLKKGVTLPACYNGTITVLDDCLVIDATVLISCFSQINTRIVGLIKTVFSTDTYADVKNLVMFGDLAESKIIQTAVENEFKVSQAKIVLVPTEPSLAVLKGAVICGHDPVIIGNEVNRYKFTGYQLIRCSRRDLIAN